MPSNVPSTYHHPRTYLSPREMERPHENLDKLSQFRQLDMWELMAKACHQAYLRGLEHANQAHQPRDGEGL